MIDIKEFDYQSSKHLLKRFQIIEKSYGANWFNCEDENSQYIWIIENTDNPLGFLSFKILIHPNQKDFIYIVKIYVQRQYRGENPLLVNKERVSQILFRQIESKGVNILTLESADEKLDAYYEQQGFKYNEDISNFFAPVIGTNDKVVVKFLHREIIDEDLLKKFGKQDGIC